MKVRDAIRLLETTVGFWYEPRAVTGNFITQPRRERSPWRDTPGIDIPKGTLNSILKQAGLKE